MGKPIEQILPPPDVLRRRHEALVAVEDLLVDADDCHRMFGTEGPGLLWFKGNAHRYQLVLDGQEAVLSVFDYEAPQSPWRHPDLPEDGAWPGMFDGMPDRLRRHLPAREADNPLSVSAGYWFTGGAWHTGNPEPVEDDFYDGDPGGAMMLTMLLDLESGVEDLVGVDYEQPERLDEALALARSIARPRTAGGRLAAALDIKRKRRAR